MYICGSISHRIISPNRPDLHPAIDLAARPRAVRSARPEIHASAPWLTPSLRCARRNLLQASPRECCTTAVLPCCRRDSAERKIVAGPLYRAVCAWPLHLQTLFSLSFPAFPEAAAAYFLLALYRCPTPSRSHSGHNGRTHARRRQLLALEGHVRRPPSFA